MRPTDLNDPGFFSRFANDISTLATNIPRALLEIGGSVVGDTVGAVGRGLVPGGHPGFWRDEDGDAESQVLDNVLKPMGESLVNTADLLSTTTGIGDLARGYSVEEWSQRVHDRKDEFFESPGLFTVEHVGNAAIAGAAVSQPLKAAARSAAGKAAGKTISKKGLTRKQKRQQIQDIIDTEGPGSGLARAGQLTGDVVGRPYTRLGRAAADTKLPNIRSAIEGRSVRGVDRNASLREVAQQVKTAVPEDRMIWTDVMKSAADLRTQRASVASLEQRAKAAEAAGDPDGAAGLWDQHSTAASQLAEFETANAGRLTELENTRLTPVAPDELSSPMARDIRKVLNQETMQDKTAPFASINRQLKGRTQQLKEDVTSGSLDSMAERSPYSRIRASKRQLRDLDTELRRASGGTESLETFGITAPKALGRMNDADLYQALDAVRQNPELRAKLPKVEGQLELTMIDLYEKMNDLPDGSLRNRLYDDATLTPELAETVRNLNRLVDGEAPAAGAAAAGPPRDLTDAARQAVEDALGEAYRIPTEQLTDVPTELRPVMEAARRQLTRESEARDLAMAELGYLDETRSALRVTREPKLSEPLDNSGLDAFFEETFGEGADPTARQKAVHPRSGYEVDVGEIRSIDQPARGSGSMPAEGPAEFKVRRLPSPDDPNYGRLSMMGGEALPNEPIRYVYRGVSADEMAAIRRDGVIRSDGRGAIDPEWEGTNAAADPRTAVSYLPLDGEGYVIRMRVDPSDGWFTNSADPYLRTRNPIPADRMDVVSSRVVREKGTTRVVEGEPGLRALDSAAGENPVLQPTASAAQTRVLKNIGARIAKNRSRLQALEERAERTNVAGKANAFDAYRTAVREQQKFAFQWDRARKAGDLELAATLRKQLDSARSRAQKAKVAARKDLYETTKGMQREIQDIVKEMSDAELPVGVQQTLNAELASMLSRLESAFSAADVKPSASLRKSLQRLKDAGLDLTAVDANALDNLLRLGEVADGDLAAFQAAARGAEEAVAGNRAAVNQVTKVRNILEAQTRARVAQRDLNRLERRLDSVDGRLADVDVDAVDAARVRAQDAADLATDVAERAGVKKSSPRTPSGKRALEDRLLREQVQARLRQREVQRAADAVDRAEAKFTEVQNELLNTVDAAPAVARPFLQVARRLEDLDKTLRAEGLTQLADDLKLDQLPRTLEAMNEAGVSPTFLRRLEERLGATGQRASTEGPVKNPTMSAQRRRGMVDMDVMRDIDRVKLEADLELAKKVLTEEFIGEFNQKFGKTQDQIAAQMVEAGNLNWDAWLDMRPDQKAKILRDAGYNTYNPEQIFAFRTRKVADDAVWIPQALNESLTQYAKRGPFEKLLQDWIQPGTTLWKHSVLALRPAWHVYNIVGNAMMMGFAGNMSPKAYVEFMKPGSEAHTMLRRHRLGWDLSEDFGLDARGASELFDSGLSRDLAPDAKLRGRLSDALREPESVKRLLDRRASRSLGKARDMGKEVIGASYRTNAFFDNLNRASMYLYDVNKAGMSPEAAIKHANRVLGEYTKMTPFEKIYVRSAFPFYAWMRHITRLSSDMLRPESITRATTLGQVVQILGEPNGDEALFPGYMAGDVLLPDLGIDALDGVAVGMRGFNPWQDVLDVGVYNEQISARGATRSMHPLAQFVQERVSGTSVLTGRPFSRPVPVLDDLGREIPTPPPLGKHMFDTFGPPQAQLAQSIGRAARGKTVPQYASGDPVLIEGARSPNLAAGIGGFLGAPLRFPDTEDIQERRDTAIDRNLRTMERYRLELEEYERQRDARSLPQKLTPFGQ